MQISKIILWPIDKQYKYRAIDFSLNKVNFLIGDASTGKSSIWPIVDYCLGSSRLRVPLGIIRDKVSWYGIVLVHNNENILIARKNYSIDNSKSEWMLSIGDCIVVPDFPSKTKTTIDDIKSIFSTDLDNFISKLNSDILEELDSYKFGKYSYRDLLALNHQVQYALVNPSSLFVKHIDDISILKLKKILPIILFDKQEGQFNLKKSEKGKVLVEGYTIRKEVDHLEEKMKSLYCEAHELNMVISYVEPNSNWPTERYKNELNYIYERYSSLLYLNNNMKTEVDQELINKIFLIGRIYECLQFSGIIDRIKELRFQYLLLDSELKKINNKKSYSYKYNNTNEISDLIHQYASKMNLDFLNLIPYFDQRDSTIKFYDEDASVFYSLSEFGTTQNFIGYNISVFLAFHEIVHKKDFSFIFPFLFIDQPSQGFSTEDEADLLKLKSLFLTLDMAIERMNYDFQIIVLEKISLEEFSKLKNSVLVETWFSENNEALIPNFW